MNVTRAWWRLGAKSGCGCPNCKRTKEQQSSRSMNTVAGFVDYIERKQDVCKDAVLILVAGEDLKKGDALVVSGAQISPENNLFTYLKLSLNRDYSNE